MMLKDIKIVMTNIQNVTEAYYRDKNVLRKWSQFMFSFLLR